MLKSHQYVQISTFLEQLILYLPHRINLRVDIVDFEISI